MDLPYDELSTESLQRMLDSHRTNLEIWSEQATKHGELHTPANLMHQINDTKDRMQKIKSALLLKGQRTNQENISLEAYKFRQDLKFFAYTMTIVVVSLLIILIILIQSEYDDLFISITRRFALLFLSFIATATSILLTTMLLIMSNKKKYRNQSNKNTD